MRATDPTRHLNDVDERTENSEEYSMNFNKEELTGAKAAPKGSKNTAFLADINKTLDDVSMLSGSNSGKGASRGGFRTSLNDETRNDLDETMSQLEAEYDRGQNKEFKEKA
jgi:hypothetical protein